MPLTAKGEEIMENMRKQYGERAEEVFYAAKNAGTITGVDQTPAGILPTIGGSVPAMPVLLPSVTNTAPAGLTSGIGDRVRQDAVVADLRSLAREAGKR